MDPVWGETSGSSRPQDGAKDSKKLETNIAIVDKDQNASDKEDGLSDSTSDPVHGEEENTAVVHRLVIGLREQVRKTANDINQIFKGRLLTIILVLLYFAYFIYAMIYRFGDEASVRLLWCTLLGVVIAVRHRVWELAMTTSLARWWNGERSQSATEQIEKLRFFTKWLLYGGVGAFMAYVIVDVAIKDADKLRSLPGIVVFLLVCFLFSSAPAKVNWHTIYWSVGLQFILAVLVIRWQGGKDAVLWIQERLNELFAHTKPAAILLFGPSYMDHQLIFAAFPIIFFTNSVLAILYYLGAMQFVIRIIGTFLCFVLRASPVESAGVAASIFLESAAALLSLHPYLEKLSHSELFTLLTACLASIGGTFIVLLTSLGIPVELTLPAMVISAPATFAVCKLMYPDTGKTKKIHFSGVLPPDMQYSGLLEAAQAGAVSVLSVVTNIVITAYTFYALLTWANETMTWFGDRVGIEQLTLEKILSYLFYPLALLMGVDLEDCRSVAMLMGLRLSASNFIALLKMLQLASNRLKFQQYALLPNATLTYVGDHIILDQWNVTLLDGYISRRSEAIATYSLCGFSGVLSMFLMVGIMSALVPSRRQWLLSMLLPLLVAGNVANFMVGCFAGLLL